MSSGESLTGKAIAVYRRSIEFDVADAGEVLEIGGRLRDTRPWPINGKAVALVHDMEIRVTVGIDDMIITGASAHMHAFPHTECSGIVRGFAGLVGLGVARGYTREVQARFGGARGCTHFEQLARSLGPVVVQAVTSRRALAVSRGETDDLIIGQGSPWVRDSCHVWAEGGIADQKLAAGWHPGIGPYPSPPLEAFVEPGPRP